MTEERLQQRRAARRGTVRRRRLAAAGVVGALVLIGVAVLAYRHFHRASASTQPAERTVTVTIPEGYSRPQAAVLAREDGLRGSYLKASRRSRYLNPARYGGQGAKSLEGFLFPDTFDLPRHAAVAELVQLQLEDFKHRIKGLNMAYARSKNLTIFDVVTIASMVEREAGTEHDRPLVAAVIYNRLREGMALGIDATTRFATGNYTRPLTESELAVESPYNTRTHTGLPPGPIDSPGLASIEAAAHPARVAYLFYVVKPGACNELAFAKTEAEFEADVARYNDAREAAGGNSPTKCP
jgi:peptidoglycan lytic transglycosylase G